MRRLLILLAVLALLWSCKTPPAQPPQTGEEESFKPRMELKEAMKGAFRFGPVPKFEISEKRFIKVRTTSGRYGYLYIQKIEPLEAEWVVFEEDGKVMDHGDWKEVKGPLDMDGDGVADVTPEVTYLDFGGKEKYSLYSYEFSSGIFYYSKEGWKAFGADPRLKPSVLGDIVPSATQVAFKKEVFTIDAGVGDVIFDMMSYEYTGEIYIRRIEDIQDKGAYVILRTSTISIQDVSSALVLNGSFDGEDTHPLFETLRGDDLFDYSASKTLYTKSSTNATVNLRLDFRLKMDSDFDVSMDYSWKHFEGEVRPSLSLKNHLYLLMHFEGEYEKKGETKPFAKPSFAFSLYGIPIVVSFPMYAGYELKAKGTADATTGYEMEIGVEGMARLEVDAGLSGVDMDTEWEVNPRGDATPLIEYTVNGKAYIRGYLGVDVEVSVADLLKSALINHPYLKPQAEGTLVGNPYPDGVVVADMPYGIDFSGKVEADLKIWSGEKEKHLKDWEIGKFGPWNFGFPAPPGDLKLTYTESGILVSWKDNSSFEDGYEVRRKSISGGSWILDFSTDVSKDSTSFLDTSASSSDAYLYEVAAFSDWPVGHRYRSSWISAEFSGVPPPEPVDPYVLPYSTAASRYPVLWWSCPGASNVSFDIYLGKSDPPPLYRSSVLDVEVGTEKTGRFAFKVRDALDGSSTYHWKIVVRNSQGLESKGEVWRFTTVGEDERYAFVSAYATAANLGYGMVIPGLSVESRVWVDGEEHETPATVLVHTSSFSLLAQYYPDEEGEDVQWLFEKWSDGSGKVEKIVHEGDEDVWEWFLASQFLRLEISVVGEGSVSRDPEGRKGFHEYGEVVTLVATPNEGSEFDGWYEGRNLLGSEETIQLVVDSPRRIEARFSKVLHTLQVSSTPVSATVVVDGENHTTPFSIDLSEGTHVLRFDEIDFGEASSAMLVGYWKVGDEYYDGDTLELNLTSDSTAELSLNVYHRVDLRVDPTDGGTVTVKPVYEGYVRHGETITIEATPESGYVFSKFLIDGGEIDENPASLEVLNPLDVVAEFMFSP